MVNKRTWKEFRDSGMLWWINMILHTFGWAITVEMDKSGAIIDCYPSRVKYRGFLEEDNTAGYKRVSQYMFENAADLLLEAEE